MLASVRKIEKQLQTGEKTETIGKFNFKYGVMDFQIDPPSGNSQKITLTLHLNSGETAQGIAYFDRISKKISKWVEKN